jgi:hypothetical protein
MAQSRALKIGFAFAFVRLADCAAMGRRHGIDEARFSFLIRAAPKRLLQVAYFGVERRPFPMPQHKLQIRTTRSRFLAVL